MLNVDEEASEQTKRKCYDARSDGASQFAWPTRREPDTSRMRRAANYRHDSAMPINQSRVLPMSRGEEPQHEQTTRTESGETPVNKGSLRELARPQGTFNPDAASLVDRLKGKVEETKGNDSSEDVGTCTFSCASAVL